MVQLHALLINILICGNISLGLPQDLDVGLVGVRQPMSRISV